MTTCLQGFKVIDELRRVRGATLSLEHAGKLGHVVVLAGTLGHALILVVLRLVSRRRLLHRRCGWGVLTLSAALMVALAVALAVASAWDYLQAMSVIALLLVKPQ